jgi:hypothetical protein
LRERERERERLKGDKHIRIPCESWEEHLKQILVVIAARWYEFFSSRYLRKS